MCRGRDRDGWELALYTVSLLIIPTSPNGENRTVLPPAHAACCVGVWSAVCHMWACRLGRAYFVKLRLLSAAASRGQVRRERTTFTMERVVVSQTFIPCSSYYGVRMGARGVAGTSETGVQCSIWAAQDDQQSEAKQCDYAPERGII